MYADQLQFLNKLFQSRQVSESLEIRTNIEDEDVDNPSEVPLPPKEANCDDPKPREYKRRRRFDEVELKMIKALDEPSPSPHISFVQGLLPHLNSFDDSEVLEFQMGVLEVISKIKNKRKNIVEPQLLPPFTHHSYYPNNSYSNQFSPINTFNPHQTQTHQYLNPQAHIFKNPKNPQKSDSNHQQSSSSKVQQLQNRPEETTAQYYQDFAQTSEVTSPDTYPSASPSPVGSVYSDHIYDFS